MGIVENNNAFLIPPNASKFKYFTNVSVGNQSSFKGLNRGPTYKNSNNQVDRVLFTGKKADVEDFKTYLKDLNLYLSLVDVHNRLICSCLDDWSMVKAIKDAEKLISAPSDNIYNDVKDKMIKQFAKLKASNTVVLEGTDLKTCEVLDEARYENVKNIYLELISRPETFKRLNFDNTQNILKTVLTPEDVNNQAKDLKHIIIDILPQILKAKVLVVDDPANLYKLLSDEVIQHHIIDILEKESKEEISENNKAKLSTAAEPNDDNEPSFSDAQVKINKSLKILENINNKFNITLVSKVPTNFYNILGKKIEVPTNYYDNKIMGLRHEPKNFYETKFLNELAKDSKGYNPKDVVVVVPKDAASDVVEKVKSMNKEYLFLEDWLYIYCMGNQETRNRVLKDLCKVSDKKSYEEIKSLAKELDNYLDNFINIYDLRHPENNDKLTGLMKDFGKISCMSEISAEYYLGMNREAKDLIKLFLGLYAIGESAERLSKAALDGASVGIVAETLVGATEDISEACQNYLKWKEEFDDKEAKRMFHNTLSLIFAVRAPTLAIDLIDYSTPMKYFVIRNTSCASTYAEVISTFDRYYKKLEYLIDKGVKKVPEELKDKPDELKKWKITETWKAFAAHSLNRGEFVSIIASQPFALVAPLIVNGAYALGAGTLFVLLDQTLEDWISNMYLMLDSTNWDIFSNKMKQSFVEKKKAEMTPDKFLQLRKSFIMKTIESGTGQVGVGTYIKAQKYAPKFVVKGVKKATSIAFDFYSRTLGWVISSLFTTYLDKKYDLREKMTAHNLN